MARQERPGNQIKITDGDLVIALDDPAAHELPGFDAILEKYNLPDLIPSEGDKVSQGEVTRFLKRVKELGIVKREPLSIRIFRGAQRLWRRILP